MPAPQLERPFTPVPLARLLALEEQLFGKLPNNLLGHDLRAVILEAILARRQQLTHPPQEE